jgi:hypothetical protein
VNPVAELASQAPQAPQQTSGSNQQTTTQQQPAPAPNTPSTAAKSGEPVSTVIAPKEKPTEGTSSGATIGIVVGVLAICAAVGTAYMRQQAHKKRRHSSIYRDDAPVPAHANSPPPLAEIRTDANGGATERKNVRFMSKTISVIPQPPQRGQSAITDRPDSYFSYEEVYE